MNIIMQPPHPRPLEISQRTVVRFLVFFVDVADFCVGLGFFSGFVWFFWYSVLLCL